MELVHMEVDEPLLERHPLDAIKLSHEIIPGVEIQIIKTLNYNDPFQPANELRDTDSAFKIVQINYETTDRGLAYIISQQFQFSFFTYQRAFVIIIDGDRGGNPDDLEGISRIFGRQNLPRPIIICIQPSDKECTIFYRNPNEDFQVINWNDARTFCFKKLLCRIRRGEFGEFNGKFLETQVNNSESFDFKRLIDQALASNDLLCIRFLQLFGPDLNIQNQAGFKPLEYAAQYGDDDGFLAVFGLSFQLQSIDLMELTGQQIMFLFHQTYHRG